MDEGREVVGNGLTVDVGRLLGLVEGDTELESKDGLCEEMLSVGLSAGSIVGKNVGGKVMRVDGERDGSKVERKLGAIEELGIGEGLDVGKTVDI